ncbi:glycosyltransferase [Rhodobacterales bacterium FZCC0069]|nr:glycosyltransferase [Rhodobacterales bacterium FZCC0069]
MRILLLSFYYPPDIGPGPIRAKSIVDALRVVSDLSGAANLSIDVLTTMPNRYHSMTADALEVEAFGEVTIRRFRLPAHKSDMAGQSRAFVVYANAVQRQVKNEAYDVVIATSSRLLTASLGAWVARKSHAKLYLDIRDLFTDTLTNLLANNPLRMLLPLFNWLERWTFRQADRLNVVSAGFLRHMQAVVPTIQPTVLTNGIDGEFLNTDFSLVRSNAMPLVLYAGNMGDGQGLHRVIPPVARALQGQVNFRLLGDGGRKQDLMAALSDSSSGNVEVLAPVSREALLNQYRNADALLLHLNDYPAFQKVLPSKIFEYAATGKPILAGVSGHAAQFLREQVPGVEIFSPCDVIAMERGLKRLLAGPRMIDRKAFCARYQRNIIMQRLAEDILSLGSHKL